jgi:hypothetical protein
VPPISFERTFQVIIGEDKNSMLGDCFYVLVTLIPSLLKTGLILPHARAIIVFSSYIACFYFQNIPLLL